MKKSDMASSYDSAGTAAAAAPAGGGSFADDYDQAGAGGDQQQPADPDGDGAQDQASDLDIPAADVTKMQALKDKGDMAGLGQYVSQFLN